MDLATQLHIQTPFFLGPLGRDYVKTQGLPSCEWKQYRTTHYKFSTYTSQEDIKRKTRRNCLPAWIMRAHIPGGHFHYQAEGVEERKIKRGRKRDEEEEEEVNGIEFPMVYITSHDRGHYMFNREREGNSLSFKAEEGAHNNENEGGQWLYTSLSLLVVGSYIFMIFFCLYFFTLFSHSSCVVQLLHYYYY